MDAGAMPDLDVRRYLDGLRRRKLTVLAVVALAVATAIAVSVVQDRVYGARADILLQPSGSPSLFENSTGQPQIDPTLAIDTEIKVIESKPVRAAVVAARGQVPKVSAARIDQTLIIGLTGYGPSPQVAADIANAYADAYIALRQNQATEELASAGTALQKKLDDLQAEIDQIDESLRGVPAGGTAPSSNLAARRESLISQQNLFRQRLDELQVDTQLRTFAAHVVARATPPSSPVKPKPVRNVLLALAVGTMFGVGLACLQEYLDDSVRTEEDLAGLTGLPVLGTIPSFAAPRDGIPTLVVSSDAHAHAAEAYRSLRTSVQLLGAARPLTAIQFTSPDVGVGKTTTVANLATVLAAAGQRVAVIDSDLRRPRLHDVFGIPNERGLTSVLVGDATLAGALQPVPGYPGLQVLTAGAVAPNPSELLSLKRTAEVVFELQSTFDVVLIDSPPVLPVTDAIVMSSWAEAVLIVAASGQTRRNDLRRALELLKQVAAPVVGAILSRTTPESGYYGYGYGYGYAATAATDATGATARQPNGRAADGSPGAIGRARRRWPVADQP